MIKHTHGLALFAIVALTGCANAPLEGRFTGITITPVPSPPLPAGDLEIDATLALERSGTFDLDMDLEFMSLLEEIHLVGTYVAANGMLTLTPTGFDLTGSENMASVREEDGAHCIVLDGFASTPVCFDEQTSAFTLEGDELTFTLAHEIAGVAGTTEMPLVRQR